MTQTLWSFQSFSLLKEANFQVVAAEASYQGAQQSLLLRVSQAYFGILSAADHCRPTAGSATPFSIKRKRSTTPPNKASSMRQNALDDANLAMAEIIGQPVANVAPLREEIQRELLLDTVMQNSPVALVLVDAHERIA